MEKRKREEWSGRWKVVDLSEMDGKAGYYGTRYALIRESRIFREGARNFCEDRKKPKIQVYMQKNDLLCN